MHFKLDEDEEIIKKIRARLIQKYILRSEGWLCLTNRKIRFGGFLVEEFSYSLDSIVGIQFDKTWRVFTNGIKIEFDDGRKEHIIPFNAGSLYAGGQEDLVSEILKAKAAIGSNKFSENLFGDNGSQDPINLLSKKLNDFFSVNELRTICFDLNIDYENLAGNTKEEKIQELIAYCQIGGLVEQLIEVCRNNRPSLNI